MVINFVGSLQVSSEQINLGVKHLITSFYFNCRYRVSVLVLTYLSYMTYHLSRKPISIVKNVLNQNCTGLPTPPSVLANISLDNQCGWAPFGMNCIYF